MQFGVERRNFEFGNERDDPEYPLRQRYFAESSFLSHIEEFSELVMKFAVSLNKLIVVDLVQFGENVFLGFEEIQIYQNRSG